MHLHLNRHLTESDLEASTRAQLDVLRDPSMNSHESLATAHKKLENDAAIDSLICSMFQKIQGSDMAKYWIDFMTMVEILMMIVHIFNWEGYLTSLQKMMSWLLIYDQTNWLPHFWAKLSSLPTEQTQFFSSNFAQSMTGNPYSSIPLDMWIEVTMNKGSKMKAGWL